MAELIGAVASLLWPALALTALLVFRAPLSRLIRSAEHREWTIEVGGQTITVKQLSDQQSALIVDLQEQVGTLHQTVAELKAAQPAPPGLPGPPTVDTPAGPRPPQPRHPIPPLPDFSSWAPVSPAPPPTPPAPAPPAPAPPSPTSPPPAPPTPASPSPASPSPASPSPASPSPASPSPASPSPTSPAPDASPAEQPLLPPEQFQPPVPVTSDTTPVATGPHSYAAPPRPRAYSVLWVDDNPQNNALLIEQLARYGLKVDLAISTQDGLHLLSRRRYGMVISDMVRQENGARVVDAGMRLLAAVRQLDPEIPFVLYCNPRARDLNHDLALAQGANAITSSGATLLEQLRTAKLL